MRAHEPLARTPVTTAPAPEEESPERGRREGRGMGFAREQLEHDLADGHDEHAHDHDHARPGPDGGGSGATLGRRPGEDVDAATRQSLMSRLQGLPESARTLATIRALAGGLDFPMKWSGRGTYMSAGSVFIDIRARDTEALVTLAHELVHLKNYLAGKKPDPLKLSREDYIKQVMADELESEASGTVVGLQATGGKGEPRSKDFRRSMEAQSPGAIGAAARTGQGWDAIKDKAAKYSENEYRTRYRTSNTGQNYYDYWGSFWDKNNGNRNRTEDMPVRASGPAGGPTGRGGPETSSVLKEDQLKPLNSKHMGPELFINDNPETFRKPGVLGSTMGPVPGRGDTSHTFVGQARFFALAQNGTGKAQRNQVLIKNTFNKDLTFTIKGTVFVNKGVTPTDGRIKQGYQKNGGFQGPQAIAATSFLDAAPGKNGYFEKKVTIKAGDTDIVNNQYHEMGSEVFTLLEINASDAKGTFSLGHVSSDKTLDEKGINSVANGTYPAAGDVKGDKDFASADGSKMGRPNGVITGGSIVTGGRVVEVSKGARGGDLVMATDTRNSGGNKSEIAKIDKALPNPKGHGSAATQDDGNYGMEYQLAYMLKNSSADKVRVQVFLTAPKQGDKDILTPAGGVITMPVEMNGKRIEVRVNSRGTGVLLGSVTVAPGKTAPVNLRWVHMGNTFPPAGVEFRGE